MSIVKPKQIILKCGLPPGDIVALTAAVRDLHVCHPGRFLTDVRTPFPELWENNPHLTPLDAGDPLVQAITCDYPLIRRCNKDASHFLDGFIEFLNARLQLAIRLTQFKGDIHISPEEKAWFSQVQELTGEDTPFWIILAGGKEDVTIKWWETQRYQDVVDHFRGKVQFVQVGRNGDHHPPLNGVIDLRGRTDLRQLIRLVYHAQGVLCPVTCVMHLAAAVEVKGAGPKNRPCVVVAGGREPPHWEAYPHHQFIHTCGALLCCDQGGCWKSRTRPLGDGDERDAPENLCAQPVGALPRCMDMIAPREVIRRVEFYFQGGAVSYLSQSQARCAQAAADLSTRVTSKVQHMDTVVFKRGAQEFIRRMRASSPMWSGRGIVVCGGGRRYFPSAWVCVQILRRLGCQLPIQLWHLGPEEVTPHLAALLRPLDVQCVDAFEVRKRHPMRILHGWESKPYAIRHSPFREVLFLDADNVAVVNPEFLFDTPQFGKCGAVFWPDRGIVPADHPIWEICGLPQRAEQAFESGQILIDKTKCQREIELALWMNAHSDFYYRFMYGDKETFHFAWRMLATEYAMPSTPLHDINGTLCQHDFMGRRIFQHRSRPKWNLVAANPNFPGLLFHSECCRFLEELSQQWQA
jgi:hypothetical protein